MDLENPWHQAGLMVGGVAAATYILMPRTATRTDINLDLPDVPDPCTQYLFNDHLRPQGCDTLANRLDLHPSFYAQEFEENLCYRDGPGDFPISIVTSAVSSPEDSNLIAPNASQDQPFEEYHYSAPSFASLLGYLSAHASVIASGFAGALYYLLPLFSPLIVALWIFNASVYLRTETTKNRRLENEVHLDRTNRTICQEATAKKIAGLEEAQDTQESKIKSFEEKLIQIETDQDGEIRNLGQQLGNEHKRSLKLFSEIFENFGRVFKQVHALETGSASAKTTVDELCAKHLATETAFELAKTDFNARLNSMQAVIDGLSTSHSPPKESVDPEAQLTKNFNEVNARNKALEADVQEKDAAIKKLVQQLEVFERQSNSRFTSLENQSEVTAKSSEDLIAQLKFVKDNLKGSTAEHKIEHQVKEILALSTSQYLTNYDFDSRVDGLLEGDNVIAEAFYDHNEQFKEIRDALVAMCERYQPPVMVDASNYSSGLHTMKNKNQPLDVFLKSFVDMITGEGQMKHKALAGQHQAFADQRKAVANHAECLNTIRGNLQSLCPRFLQLESEVKQLSEDLRQLPSTPSFMVNAPPPPSPSDEQDLFAPTGSPTVSLSARNLSPVVPQPARSPSPTVSQSTRSPSPTMSRPAPSPSPTVSQPTCSPSPTVTQPARSPPIAVTPTAVTPTAVAPTAVTPTAAKPGLGASRYST